MSNDTNSVLPRGLYGIADASFGPPHELAACLVDAGCRVIQLRAKTWTTAQRADCARSLVEQLGDRACLVMNDDLEAAAWSGAGGLHLGQEDGALATARARLGPRALLGRSTHSLEQIGQLEPEVDYIGFGPVFVTATKEGAGHAWGLPLLAAAVLQSPVPVVAIGGIGLHNIDAVKTTGTHSWAVISDIFRASTPVVRAQLLLR